MFHLEAKYAGTKQLLNKKKTKQIIFRHSHIAITDYDLGDNREFEKLLSIWDKMTFKYVLMGGYYVKALREFRINRGFNVYILRQHFPGYPMVVENCEYESKSAKLELYTAPRSDFQKVALSFMLAKGEFTNNSKFTQQMITAQTGEGKCLRDDTLIPTSHGKVRLDEIKVGDQVYNRAGKPITVIGVYPNIVERDSYQVTFADGRYVNCTNDHMWTVYSRKTKDHNKLINVTLSDMMNDYSDIRIDSDGGRHAQYKYSVPVADAVEYDSRPVPVDPYVLGVFIGNGCLTNKPLTLSSDNMYITAEVARRLHAPTNTRRYGNYNHTFCKKEFYVDSLDKTKRHHNYQWIQTKDFLKDIPELIGSTSKDKFIPQDYLYNSEEVRWEVLRGLMDTDGHISKKKYQLRYSTISTKLKDNLVELVRSLGYAPRVRIDSRKEKYSTGVCYTIYIPCPDADKVKFFKMNHKSMQRARAAVNYHTRKRFDRLSIVKIEKLSKKYLHRCILVNDPEHLFLCGDYIVTHNTYCGTAITALRKTRALVIVPLAKLLPQWAESFTNFTSVKEDEILMIQGGKKCNEILEGKHKDKKVFIAMIDTIAAFNKRYGDIKTMDLLSATRAEIKIVDEIHLDLKAISMLEAMSNFKYNYYMSATPGRTDGKENWMFKQLFYHVPKFGGNFKTQEEKHLNIMVKRYYFTPTQKQINRMVNRKVGINTKLYEKELIYSPPEVRKSFQESLKLMLSWANSQVKEGNKIMILGQSIDFLKYMYEIIQEVIPADECGLYYGGMKEVEKEESLKKKVIVATTSTLGTGADIKGLQFVINAATYSSWVMVTQVSGRLRKLSDGTPTVYIELVNFGYLKTIKQFENRKPHLLKASRSNKIIIVD